LRLLDTSVILRFLTRDDARKAERVKKLLLESDEELFITEGVFFELEYVLEKSYGLSRTEVFVTLSKLLSSRRVEFAARDILWQALSLYREHDVSFIDAYQAASGRALGAEAIYTYDEDFEGKLGFPGLRP